MNNITEKHNRIILGIDPGSLNFGYCILQQNGRKYTLITKGILKLQTISDQINKNKKIYEFLSDLHQTYLVDEISIEQPVYGKDAQAMLKLGRVLGCCIGFAISHNLPIMEYPPKTVKRIITGNGNAAKQQVAFMAANILGITYNANTNTFDDMDAAAIALTHAYNLSGIQMTSAKKSWEKFIKENPDRIEGLK